MPPKLVVPGPAPPCALRRRPNPPPWTTQSAVSRQQCFFSPSPPTLAQPRPDIIHGPQLTPVSPTLFSQTGFRPSLSDGLDGGPQPDHKPPDERILKLGNTLRILSPRLPTLLTNPLPTKILSPSVTLHLFPSTHPHLPNVKGRTLYRAVLWTVPVAWSSLPLLGNVKLQILSERIVHAGTVLDPGCNTGYHDPSDERLVVRWRTEPRSDTTHPVTPNTSTSTAAGPATSSDSPSNTPDSHLSSSKTGINKGLSVLLGGDAPIFKLSKEEQFTGLFIFSFDEEGRIASHTIEHADNARGWDRTSKFVTLTDWLIGKARGSLDPATEPGFAIQGCHGYELPCSSRDRSSDSDSRRWS
ncbi:hypothetical protein BO70DRAFT_346477 [Aspergillus heteromorphus CBS 117.55]|uniref:Uncharacterized protein n=1 Tax=Aspergillus heteromorphus CBS 117.55 TaxID=1448321 RepID=A0A317UZE2_9EURO|nr:uncharacterized protein BO70DRAFT_346477 [Aspergillus heteromorphus CBS 117.55]PWY65310.1 hypothetical protein BO70DRAFT_346477 [Aspergillus heteromorphus CBS 117.55]